MSSPTLTTFTVARGYVQMSTGSVFRTKMDARVFGDAKMNVLQFASRRHFNLPNSWPAHSPKCIHVQITWPVHVCDLQVKHEHKAVISDLFSFVSTLSGQLHHSKHLPRLSERKRTTFRSFVNGWIRAAVSRSFHVSPGTILKLRNRDQHHETTRDFTRSGRSNVSTTAPDRYIRVRHSKGPPLQPLTASAISGCVGFCRYQLDEREPQRASQPQLALALQANVLQGLIRTLMTFNFDF